MSITIITFKFWTKIFKFRTFYQTTFKINKFKILTRNLLTLNNNDNFIISTKRLKTSTIFILYFKTTWIFTIKFIFSFIRIICLTREFFLWFINGTTIYKIFRSTSSFTEVISSTFLFFWWITKFIIFIRITIFIVQKITSIILAKIVFLTIFRVNLIESCIL